ncbi:hypothetical protein HMPREF1986_00833 [Oribacterium sp. oral taxon 078 str. F0263]|nr:hypothetical protein HMPREF1986_00833 [Oribacterium sp. oral taxon 078 str. F0263]
MLFYNLIIITAKAENGKRGSPPEFPAKNRPAKAEKTSLFPSASRRTVLY